MRRLRIMKILKLIFKPPKILSLFNSKKKKKFKNSMRILMRRMMRRVSH
jgi:hypothetical protein